MPVGHPKNVEPKRKLNVSIPCRLLDEVTLFLPKDLITGEVRYGAWGELVESLLREYLKKAQIHV